MLVADKWTDYNLIDASDGSKLEKWGDFYLSRPDPQAIWSYKTEKELWNNAHAVYHRSKSGGGSWEYRKSFLRLGRLNMENSPLILNLWALSTQVFFPSRLQTGILS